MEPPFSRHSDGSERQGRTVNAGSGWDLVIHPCDLTFLRIDHQTRLQFEGTEVVIESPFVLTIGASTTNLTQASAPPSEGSGRS